jgi:hypothetical protein
VAFGQQAEIFLNRFLDAQVNRDRRRLLRLRGDRIIYNDREKKSENKAWRRGASALFKSFPDVPIRLNLTSAKPARRGQNKIHPLSPESTP